MYPHPTRHPQAVPSLCIFYLLLQRRPAVIALLDKRLPLTGGRVPVGVEERGGSHGGSTAAPRHHLRLEADILGGDARPADLRMRSVSYQCRICIIYQLCLHIGRVPAVCFHCHDGPGHFSQARLGHVQQGETIPQRLREVVKGFPACHRVIALCKHLRLSAFFVRGVEGECLVPVKVMQDLIPLSFVSIPICYVVLVYRARNTQEKKSMP